MRRELRKLGKRLHTDSNNCNLSKAFHNLKKECNKTLKITKYNFFKEVGPHELNFLNSLLTWLKLSYLVLKFGLTLNYCLIPSEH